MNKSDFYHSGGLTVIQLRRPGTGYVEVRHDTDPLFGTVGPVTEINCSSCNPGQDIELAATWAKMIMDAVAYATVLRSAGTPTAAEIDVLRKKVMAE